MYRIKKNLLEILNKISIVISVVLFFVVIFEHFSFFDNYFRKTNLLQKVADNFSTSYSNVQRVYRPADKEWEPLIKLIYRYSKANFPDDKIPLVVARYPAISSSKTIIGTSTIAEWTAPTTPFFVLYKEWPGNEIGNEDYRIAGTVDDLSSWIIRDKDAFRFKINDVVFAGISLIMIIITAIFSRKL